MTDKKIIDAIAYEVYLMRRGTDENGNPLDEETDEFYDEDEYPEDEALDDDDE